MIVLLEKNDISVVKGKKLIVGFPGMAFVGKVTADVLVSKLNLEEVAEIFSFQSPASVIVSKGILQPFSVKIYANEKDDVAVLTASFQPQTEEAQNSLAHDLNRKLSELKLSKVISAAAYVSREVSEKRKVFVAATKPETVEELSSLGCVPMEGGISGLNGLVPALAEVYGMEGIALLGETSEVYVASGVIDYRAVAAIMQVLSRYLGLNITTEDIIEKARELEEEVKKAFEKSIREEIEQKKGKEPSTHM